MAKPLTALKNSSQLTLNNSNTNQLSVRMTVSYLKEHLDDEFIHLFSHTDETAQHLADSFVENGYDNSQPVHLAHIDDEDRDIVIDGMTRLHALELADFFDVPVFKHSFKTRLDALMYAYRLQLDRRNLNDAQKIVAVEKMLSLKNPGQKGKKAAFIASQLNLGTRNVEKMVNIIENGDEETKQAVLNNTLSVNKADKNINHKKKIEKQSDFSLESEDFFPPDLKDIDDETKKAVIDGKKKFAEVRKKLKEKLSSEQPGYHDCYEASYDAKALHDFWLIYKNERLKEDTSKEFQFYSAFMRYLLEIERKKSAHSEDSVSSLNTACHNKNNPSGHCGAAFYCSEPYSCCASCPEKNDCNGVCGYITEDGADQ